MKAKLYRTSGDPIDETGILTTDKGAPTSVELNITELQDILDLLEIHAHLIVSKEENNRLSIEIYDDYRE